MALERVRRIASGEARGVHFAAVLFMGPLAAIAIVLLRQIHLVAPSPLWLIPTILVGGQLITTASDLWWERSRSHLRLHLRVASQAIVVTATIYATGWGPALAVGLVLVGQEALTAIGSKAQRVVLGWNLSCLAVGQILIALGWAPSLIPIPEVHGLAVLMAVGIAFSYRSLTSALIDKEDAAGLTDRRERRFRALVQSSQDLVFVVDAAGAVTYASPSCVRVLGYEPDTMLGSSTGMLVFEADVAELRQTIARAADVPGGRSEFSVRALHGDGTWRWIEGVATNLLDDPAVRGVVINARDITERRSRSDRQTAIADLGRVALRATSLDAVLESAAAVVTAQIDGSSCLIHGAGDVPNPATLASRHAPGVQRPWDDLNDRNPVLAVPVGDPDAPLAHIEVRRDRSITPEDEQFIEGVASILLSSIVRSRAEDAIRHQAMHDPLTDLPNRTLFNDRLEHALSRTARVGGNVAVMVVDLDGFKNVNDSLGHLVGDALLIAVADRFRLSLRDVDTIARLGGDEFAILVDDLDSVEQAGQVAQRVLDALVSPLTLADREVAIGASLGIAVADQRDGNTDRLLSNADAAMYRAKREGKGCYRVFEAAMHAAAVERMNLEQALRNSIANNILTVHYQPVIDTRTGLTSSLEALARWPQPDHSFVPPDVFIPVAEDTGLIIDLGRAVLFEACRQTRIWHAKFPHLRPSIAVNVSRLQLIHPTFVADVADALTQAGIGPSSLIIEVTESALVAESGRITGVLAELHRTGVRIAIDDFGTGYSSFAALAELPIDIVKIDKRFTDNVLRDHEGLGFVNAILHLARTLHLDTVVEGVEQPEQRDALEGLGVTHLQGYLFSRPLPAEATLEYLTEHNATEPLRVALLG
jgi:diguanylate cyclase (GGDEF)-like protein/PAS domain S-box-containing protein